MKKIIAVVFFAFCFFKGIHAQTTSSGQSSAQQNTSSSHHQKNKDIYKNLNLTGDQKNKIKNYRADAKKQKESIQNDKSLSDSQKQGKLKELKKQTREKQKSVLTKEQQAQWKTAKKNARKQKS